MKIDINSDVGEGIGNERQLFPFISSCNIACGGHAGDVQSMHEVVALAKEYRIKIGAHPSYPDTENFGRVSLDISETELVESIREQLGDLQNVLREEAVTLHHIKPHGALYNGIAKDIKMARTFLKAITTFRHLAVLYVPYASAIAFEALRIGFRVQYEAFADRNYNSDLSLVSRSESDALIVSPENVLKHVVGMAIQNQVTTSNGERVSIIADTYCIHGDSPAALQILMYLDKELPNHNIQIKK